MSKATVTKIQDQMYHGMTGHISASMLKEMNKTPLHCYHMMNSEREETEALLFGRQFHAFILDGEEHFNTMFRVQSFNWTTIDGRKEKAEFERLGLKRISPSHLAAILGMDRAIKNHREASKLFDECQSREMAIIWEDKVTGAECRCKPDGMNQHGLFDLKSTNDASPEAFQRDAFKYGYHIQASHYTNGHKAAYGDVGQKFSFIVVEKEAPFAVAVYEFDEETKSFANTLTERLISDFVQCKDNSVWPGYSTKTQYISIPNWRKANED